MREPANVVERPAQATSPPGDDMWLAAGPEGITLASRAGTVSWSDDPAERAFADGHGGLVYQTPGQGGAHLFLEQDGRNVFNPDYPASVIYRLPAPGADPVPLTDANVDPAAELAGVIEFGEGTLVVYSTILPGCTAVDFPDNPAWWELGCGAFTSWVARDLTTGDKLNLGQGGQCGFECGGLDLSVGPVIVSARAEGYAQATPSFHAKDTARLIAQATTEVPHWSDDPPIDASKGWTVDMSTYCIQNCDAIFAVAAPAPDGTTVLVAWTRDIRHDGWADPFDGLHLALLDASTGAVIDELEVPTLFPLWSTDDSVPVWVDFDGRSAIIGLQRWDPHQTAPGYTSPLLVDVATRTIEVLPGPTGHVTLWLHDGS